MRVLLVEDRVGKVLLKVLKKWGYQVFLAEDGERAWEILTTEDIELFLLDWMLPGMSGLDLARKIRGLDRYRTTPVVMISSRTRKEDIAQAAKVGITGYLAKPFTPVQFRKKIEEILKAQTPGISLDRRVRKIVRQNDSFDPRESTPLLLLGFGGTTEPELQTTSTTNLRCLDQVTQAIAALNSEDPQLHLNFRLAESTSQIAQMLSRWSLRERTRMVVISPACYGNSLLLVRMLGAGGLPGIPLVLLYEEIDGIPEDLQVAAQDGELHLLDWATVDVQQWQALIRPHLEVHPDQ